MAKSADAMASERRIRALESELAALQTTDDERDDCALERGDTSALRRPAAVARYASDIARPTGVNMDPFAFLCCCKFKRIGQSYVLHERRMLQNGRVRTSLVIVGPHWIGVVVTLAIILIGTGAFLQQQCTTLAWFYTPVTLAFCALTLYFLFETACRDPGIVSPKHGADDEADRRDVSDGPETASDGRENAHLLQRNDTAAAHGSDSSSSDEQLSQRSSASTVLAGTAPAAPPRFARTRRCDVCDVEQDAYTEHCDDCDVCVAEYDHHCPWMGKCIGKQNLRAFKLFNLSWVLYVVFVLSVAIQNVDWSDAAIQRLERATNGSWVPVPPHSGGHL